MGAVSISFRGKNKATNRWHKGTLIQYPDGCVAIAEAVAYTSGARYIQQETPVDPASVGMYTGWHDRDLKAIFEGDILETPHRAHRVVLWNVKRAAFRAYDKNGLPKDMDADKAYRMRIVGNITDNPDFFKDIQKRANDS